MSKITLYRWVSLIGYFGLLLLILNWVTWLAPPKDFPRSIVLILLTVPLLIPLRGMLHGRRRTHQWVIFLSLAYFMGGVDVWLNQLGQEGLKLYLGAAMTFFSIVLFVGCSYYGKYMGPPREPRKEKKARLAREAAEAAQARATK